MSGDILKEIADAAKFEMKIFDGALRIEGRILSPAEVEAAGLASALLASQVIKGKSQEQLKAMQEAAEKAQEGEAENIEMLLQMANTINPRMLEEMSVKEDQLIIRCVKRCSKDGVKWEPLHLVDAVERQDPRQNRLWVGMLLAEDRKAILDRAMKGHKEASERLKSFRGG
ncbi:MAG: hypothetical protein Unbinned5179contig1004_24 [Prokaryotic dsDNA virus sp.]|nr:MAG: hypothetical protein Unbinned5179contig1004_24 [Prokaryotic dsDNA virus sp.]|tara:strand:- start:1772 stop:2284 length:513 start_codon:yes stop_codon:yes gene_type:complete